MFAVDPLGPGSLPNGEVGSPPSMAGLFVVSVIFFPKGLIGYLAPALERRWSRR